VSGSRGDYHKHRFKHVMAERLLHRLTQIMGHSSFYTTAVYVEGAKGDL
jgi:hypothetical protein